VSATVGEGLTRWTRFETGKLTGHRFDAFDDAGLFLMTDSTATGFVLTGDYKPAGDQPQAIAGLIDGLRSGLTHQTLLGVTGSGKTFSVANVIQELQRPTLVLAHNKTLAAQLYGEFRDFFPHNAVEYFVSYYDYYQPEAYVPSSGSLRSFLRHLHREGLLDQRAHRADAPVGNQGTARAA
jgi:hypothetical protein